MRLPRFADKEKARTIEYYENTPPRLFSLADLSAELGRTRQFVSRQARLLGLTNPNRPATAAQFAAVSAPKWINKPHPRGALGLVHSASAREAISKSSLASWVKQKSNETGNMSPDLRQARSDRMSRMRAGQSGENAYSRAKQGRRSDVGTMFFRSAWEANYARYLNWLVARGEILGWEYEPKVFWFDAIKRGVRSYKPDFRIAEVGCSYWVEVKGWMDPKSKTKLKRMAKYHPNEKIIVVGPAQYAAIKRSVSRLIPAWE